MGWGGGGRLGWGGACALALKTCYTVWNLELLYGFVLGDSKVQVIIIQIAFDLNVVENCSRAVTLKPHNYLSRNSGLYCLRNTHKCLRKMQVPRPQPTL